MLDEMAIRLQENSDEAKRSVQEMADSHREELSDLGELLEEERRQKLQLGTELAGVKAANEGLKAWEDRCREAERELRGVRGENLDLERRAGELEARADEAAAKNAEREERHGRELEEERARMEKGFREARGTAEMRHGEQIKDLETQLELANVQKCEFEEDVKRLKQDIKDGLEDRKISEKKGHNMIKDLKRQLQSEKKRNEKLQEKMKECLNETASNVSGALSASLFEIGQILNQFEVSQILNQFFSKSVCD